MKKLGLITAVLVVIVAALVLQRDRIVSVFIGNAIEQTLGSDVIGEVGDGLHLALCGAGGPLPGASASGPCVAVIAGSKMFIVDAGANGSRNLIRMGLQPGRIEAVLLTHYHSDHIDGLGEMATQRWVSAGNTMPLPVYGPPGVRDVVDGLNKVYANDQHYRHQHHGETVAPKTGAGMTAEEFAMPANGALTNVIRDGDLSIEALAVEHAPVDVAVGYRFHYKGRSLLISGDTVASDNVRQYSQGIDLLVHEALAPNLVTMMHDAALSVGNTVFAKVAADIPNYHTSPAEAAQIAHQAGAGHLLYYHLIPPMAVQGQESIFLDGADEIFPDYTIGKDGVMVSLPAGSTDNIVVRDGL